MTVVAAYVGEKTIDARDSKLELSPMLSSLLIEGIAQNANGSVYAPKVWPLSFFSFYLVNGRSSSSNNLNTW